MTSTSPENPVIPRPDRLALPDLLAFPDTPAARQACEYVRAHVSEPTANHSFRSYLFGMLIADHEGIRPGPDFEPELLFLACVLHDLGTSPLAPGRQRFELDGADLAAELLTGHGFAAREVDLVWEAIALHSTPAIPERRGPIAALTRRGVGMDFGRAAEIVTEAQATEIHAHFRGCAWPPHWPTRSCGTRRAGRRTRRGWPSRRRSSGSVRKTRTSSAVWSGWRWHRGGAADELRANCLGLLLAVAGCGSCGKQWRRVRLLRQAAATGAAAAAAAAAGANEVLPTRLIATAGGA
ncbi:HD domain-containing protein [Catenulispora yoronensis]